MAQAPKNKKKTVEVPRKKKMSQGLLIAIISSVTTLVAAILSVAPSLMERASSEPTLTPFPTAIPTDTLPPATFTPESTSTPTELPVTPTPELGLSNVYLALDPEGKVKSDVFSPPQTVYVFFDLNDPSGIRRVGMKWIAIDAEFYPENFEIYSTVDVMEAGDRGLSATLNPWPVGNYKLELSLNNSLDETLTFQVK